MHYNIGYALQYRICITIQDIHYNIRYSLEYAGRDLSPNSFYVIPVFTDPKNGI